MQTVDQSVGQTAGTLVDSLVNDALALPPLPAPAWQDWNRANYPADDDAAGPIIRSQRDSWRLDYTQALLDNNLRDRMSFFWSNHFVTELEIYESPSYLYYYTDACSVMPGQFQDIRQRNRLNLRHAVLPGRGLQQRGQPERKLRPGAVRTFHPGEGNGYTEQDIIETARALSGYTERGEERGTR